MDRLIEFGRMFLSYGVLFLIFVAVIAVGVFIGITLAKRKQKKNAAQTAETVEETT